MTLYSSVDYALSIRGSVQQGLTSTTMDRIRLYRKLRQVSTRVDRVFAATRPVFAPYIETRRMPLDGQHVNSSMGTFRLDGSLLALTTLDVAGSAVTAVEGYPDSTMPPFASLRLTDCNTGWYSVACADCSAPQQVSVSGAWGYHDNYAQAWLSVDTLQANINASVTTFTVADADGEDAYTQPNRISPGHLLKLDSEYLDVTDVNSNTVTVIRGANGSTAAAHTAGATVYRWEVVEDIQVAVARQSLLMYSREGAYTTMEISPMGAEVRYPADFLAEVYGVLQGFAN